ncbi:uncharacterized protein LOC129750733 [Uranotaenia lowii]|uniref:uncharacterized protein LOC129750733 n=1 Tax=Uranotaenia lowii TaxID=190385 RepID=UPI002478A4B4|nr:uncharacterized protein LOC129750733 [Uranotaenia lowii]
MAEFEKSIEIKLSEARKKSEMKTESVAQNNPGRADVDTKSSPTVSNVDGKDKDTNMKKSVNDKGSSSLKSSLKSSESMKDLNVKTKASADISRTNDDKKLADKDKMQERQADRSTRDRSKSPRSRARSPSLRSYIRSTRSPPWRHTRNYSPRRRSRSPRGTRRRSPSRSRRSRSRSPGSRSRRSPVRSRDPKALIAKKSFLDDLAVKFAQEGKEFPELEQYRCEINNQFVSYPTRHYAHNSNDSNFNPSIPQMFMDSDMGSSLMDGQIMMTDPYNAVTVPYELNPVPPQEVFETTTSSSLISYPIAYGVQQHDIEPDMFKQFPTQPEAPVIKKKKPAEKSNLDTVPFQPLERGTKFKVKSHITQAIQILGDLEMSFRRSGKFLYRAPTLNTNNVNKNRSVLLQSSRNAVFAFTCRSREPNDPYGNVPPKLKKIINSLCLDEGIISQKISARHKKINDAIALQRQKVAVEKDIRIKQTPKVSPGPLLVKAAKPETSACTECLIRKIKVKANSSTQTPSARVVDSFVQTNPTPLNAVSEFGSINELTPNQVRAVSELIKYIKLTATSGTVEEMRNAMRNDQVQTLNSDLRTAYNYFDNMVERKKRMEHREISAGQKTANTTYNSYHQKHYEEAHAQVDLTNEKQPQCYENDPNDDYDQFHRNMQEYDDLQEQFKDPSQSSEKTESLVEEQEVENYYDDNFDLEVGQSFQSFSKSQQLNTFRQIAAGIGFDFSGALPSKSTNPSKKTFKQSGKVSGASHLTPGVSTIPFNKAAVKNHRGKGNKGKGNFQARSAPKLQSTAATKTNIH